MPIDVYSDDLNLKSGHWDHVMTEHGLESAASMHGWERKSHWQGDEDTIAGYIFQAFQNFRSWVSQQAGSTATLAQDPAGRTVVDQDIGFYVGAGRNGKPSQNVRLVLEIKHSGDCTLVTAFPL